MEQRSWSIVACGPSSVKCSFFPPAEVQFPRRVLTPFADSHAEALSAWSPWSRMSSPSTVPPQPMAVRRLFNSAAVSCGDPSRNDMRVTVLPPRPFVSLERTARPGSFPSPGEAAVLGSVFSGGVSSRGVSFPRRAPREIPRGEESASTEMRSFFPFPVMTEVSFVERVLRGIPFPENILE